MLDHGVRDTDTKTVHIMQLAVLKWHKTITHVFDVEKYYAPSYHTVVVSVVVVACNHLRIT